MRDLVEALIAFYTGAVLAGVWAAGRLEAKGALGRLDGGVVLLGLLMVALMGGALGLLIWWVLG